VLVKISSTLLPHMAGQVRDTSPGIGRGERDIGRLNMLLVSSSLPLIVAPEGRFPQQAQTRCPAMYSRVDPMGGLHQLTKLSF